MFLQINSILSVEGKKVKLQITEWKSNMKNTTVRVVEAEV